jgi:Uma2 family endonuclease
MVDSVQRVKEFGMAHNLTQTDEYIPADVARLMQQTVTPEQYEELVYKHEDLWLELTSSGELIVMPPTGLETDVRNVNLTLQLATWTEKDGSGICFGPSGIFSLPDGSRRIPDGAWVRREKWDRLTKDQQQRFGPLSPDFVVELRSRTDRLPPLRAKMVEYLKNGASLGWLIDPFERRVHVYRPDQEVVILDDPKTVSGDPLLPGFKLDLTKLW